MPDHLEVTEGAVEAGRKVFREGGFAREIVETAAPAIRKQERQRIREALEEQAAEYLREASEARQRGAQGDWEKMSTAADVVNCVISILSEPGAALDTLKDSDV